MKKVHMSNHSLCTPRHTNLSVIFDSNITFEDHVLAKCRISYARLCYLYKYKTLLSASVKWNLVNLLVLSHINYCSSVQKQVLQNCCFRFSYYVRRRERRCIIIFFLIFKSLSQRFQV